MCEEFPFLFMADETQGWKEPGSKSFKLPSGGRWPYEWLCQTSLKGPVFFSARIPQLGPGWMKLNHNYNKTLIKCSHRPHDSCRLLHLFRGWAGDRCRRAAVTHDFDDHLVVRVKVCRRIWKIPYRGRNWRALAFA